MYFCPNCSYLFDITKSSTISSIDTRKSITKIPELFKLLENDNNLDLSKYKSDFTKEELYKNKKYQKLSDNIKNNILQIFDDVSITNAQFKCDNCNFTKNITETTLLYQINVDNDNTKISNIEENKLLFNDPLYPHTHDYSCKNPNCDTHKKPNLKDSIFYRNKNSYRINYICGVCFYNW
jgi:hypothetical protein